MVLGCRTEAGPHRTDELLDSVAGGGASNSAKRIRKPAAGWTQANSTHRTLEPLTNPLLVTVLLFFHPPTPPSPRSLSLWYFLHAYQRLLQGFGPVRHSTLYSNNPLWDIWNSVFSPCLALYFCSARDLKRQFEIQNENKKKQKRIGNVWALTWRGIAWRQQQILPLNPCGFW